MKYKPIVKVYKVVEPDNEGDGTITIYGSNRWIGLHYGIPEWNKDQEAPDVEEFFYYRGVKYWLSEIMAVHNRFHNPNPPEWMREFDGYTNDSFFSGILIKMGPPWHGESGSHDCCVKAFTFIS